MQFTITDVESANAALEYFNAFHDGFMKGVVIESQDRIDPDHGQSCTGLFEVQIDLSHYNYADGSAPFHPYNQVVRSRFHEVQDIAIDLNSGFCGNTIICLSVEGAVRRPGGSTGWEDCLSLLLTRHYYLEEERRYELRECRLFTFSHATLEERPAA